MPNWVQQKVIIKGRVERILELNENLMKGAFCNVVLPMPFEHASSLDDGWRSWALKNWGTKWDVANISERTMKPLGGERNKLVFTCDTANTPPIPVWDELVRLGLQVTAAYYDPLSDLYGFYENGQDQRGDGTEKLVAWLLDVDIDEKEYA